MLQELKKEVIEYITSELKWDIELAEGHDMLKVAEFVYFTMLLDRRKYTIEEIDEIAKKHFEKSEWHDEHNKQDTMFGFRVGFLAAIAKLNKWDVPDIKFIGIAGYDESGRITGITKQPISLDKDFVVVYDLVNNEYCIWGTEMYKTLFDKSMSAGIPLSVDLVTSFNRPTHQTNNNTYYLT